MSNTPTITRRELFDEVWTVPMVQLAKKYGLSDVGLAKTCRRLNIPRPGVGHWAKKQVGKAEPQPSLPPLEDPKLEAVVLTERACEGGTEPDAPARHAIDDEVHRRIQEELAGLPIVVADTLRNPHPLIARTIEERQERAAEERRRKNNPNWYVSYREPEPRVRANIGAHSKETLARAYRIMDALFKALEDRGHSVTGKPQKHGAMTLVSILGVTFDVRIYEPSNQKPHALTPDEQRRKEKYGSVYHAKHDMVPTGRLCLQFRNEGGWLLVFQVQDGKKQRLEDRLKDVFVAALRKVDAERQEAAERERRAAVWREAERKRKDEEERQRRLDEERKQEEARVQSLLAEIGRWKRSQDIRAYLDEIGTVFAARGQVIEAGSELDQWMGWARQVAHRMNPLRPADPPSSS